MAPNRAHHTENNDDTNDGTQHLVNLQIEWDHNVGAFVLDLFEDKCFIAFLERFALTVSATNVECL